MNPKVTDHDIEQKYIECYYDFNSFFIWCKWHSIKDEQILRVVKDVETDLIWKSFYKCVVSVLIVGIVAIFAHLYVIPLLK